MSSALFLFCYYEIRSDGNLKLVCLSKQSCGHWLGLSSQVRNVGKYIKYKLCVGSRGRYYVLPVFLHLPTFG